MMKKTVIFTAALALSMCGCSSSLPFPSSSEPLDSLPIPIVQSNVDTMRNWSFQYNAGTSDYSLFFALCDSDGEYISASADVDIRIVNEYDEVVYEGTRSITKNDFGYYSNAFSEMYLANIRIPESEILEGSSSSGKIYFIVYKEDLFEFQEANCEIFYNLPIKDVQMDMPSLPSEVTITSYNNSVESVIQIEDISYKVDSTYSSQNLNITISGVKTYGSSNSGYDMFTCKLYDGEGYVVDSRSVILSSVASGERFRDDSIVFYGVKPGETYTIQFFPYTY